MHSFETSDGFCLIQEYIHGSTLAEPRSFSPAEIKQIAIKILEILVYLQNRIPSVIHRDIKPENILVDEQINVYLIDFGFARIGSHDVAGSSVFKGTPGFIPPEQMFKPTNATDLYALGATLICLLTGIKSTKIDELQDADDPYVINFRHLLPQVSLRFIGWLEKMVQPKQKERFYNAELALESLKPLDVIRVPGVDFSETVLEFKANWLGEKLTQSITIENPIPDTLLEGKWEVGSHPQDPPHTPDNHAWISVKPGKFSRNHILCQVQVDTSKLMADKQYKRQLILHSNAYPASHTLTVKVQTAALPIEKIKLPYWRLIVMFLVVVMAAMSITGSIPYVTISNVFGAVAVCWAVGMAVEMIKEAKNLFTTILVLLILGLGISVGTGIIIGFNTFILLALNGTGLTTLFMPLYAPLKRRKLIAKYRQSEESLIKP